MLVLFYPVKNPIFNEAIISTDQLRAFVLLSTYLIDVEGTDKIYSILKCQECLKGVNQSMQCARLNVFHDSGVSFPGKLKS